MNDSANSELEARGWIAALIRFCLENKLVVFLVTLLVMGGGVLVAPFDWEFGGMKRYPVAVDAIPDIGENQQIVFTEWMGRSPQDVDDQITYPLTVALLGIPEVKTIRSYSYFGFSTIYVIFNDRAEFYWSRSRILEKLNSLPTGTLPEGVGPMLGPDATALGQVFWYTLEGRDAKGQPAPGWDPQELRSIQDFNVRYALQSVEGVAEVGSVGGFVREYQIDVDPDAMRAHGVTLDMVFQAVKMSNLDVGARTIEVNRAEYVIRGLGFIKNVEDLRKVVVKASDNVPITLEQIAEIGKGPALRRGVLDKEGAEAVGGVVVVRYGANPLEVIKRVKEKIETISGGLPVTTLEDGRVSKVTIVPFYDRTGLINETLGTLNAALNGEVLITCIVVILILLHLRSSILISLMLPLAILMAFIAMKIFKVDANIVALSGIAIAIGTIVDMGIVICENILRHLEKAEPGESRLQIVFRASNEVGSAVLTAVLTTVISFLPVFFMTGAEGKLFSPLAYTKTFALIASIIIALTLIPPLAHLWFRAPRQRDRTSHRGVLQRYRANLGSLLVALVVSVLLANIWQPLGPEKRVMNLVFVIGLVGGFIFITLAFVRYYPRMLGWCLRFKPVVAGVVGMVIFCGLLMWLGIGKVLFFVPKGARENKAWTSIENVFPGIGDEFRPALDEGSFLFMPSLMPHASIGEATEVLALQDQAIRSIPEVENVVGKLGRVDSPLDPGWIGMIETVVNYKSEYITDEKGRRKLFRYDGRKNDFVHDETGNLIPDRWGRPFRQWRDHIRKPEDIWNEIARVAQVPGATKVTPLQPIETRLIMLQTGMRSAIGVKVFGPDLETIQEAGFELERWLNSVPEVDPQSVIPDRIVGKPYLEIQIDREAIARYGIHVKGVQDVIEVAVGGKRVTTTVEGRERYPVRIRYQRELRDTIESLGGILIPAPDGTQIPLRQLARIEYSRGPQVIKSEKTFSGWLCDV